MGVQHSTLFLADALCTAVLEVRIHSDINLAYFTRTLREVQSKGWKVKPVRRQKIYAEILKRQNDIRALMLKLRGAIQACYPESRSDYDIADRIYNEAARHEENMNRVGDQITRLIRHADAF